MTMEERIRQKLEEALDIQNLEIINDSDRHIGHAGHDGSGQSHFRLIIVSKSFERLGRVQRQRIVYNRLNCLFSQGLHAVVLNLYTPEEYTGK